MYYELTAKVKQVLPATTGIGKNGPWGRVTVVVEFQDHDRMKILALENGPKYEEFAKLQVGQEVKFKFDVTSREWQGKYFTSANCFSWEVQGATAPPPVTTNDDEMPF